MDDVKRMYRYEEGTLIPRDRRRLWLGLTLAIIGPLLVAPISTLQLFDQLPGIPFVLVIVLATLLGRFAAGIVATVVSVGLIDFYILGPTHGFRPRSAEDLAAILMFLVVALLVAGMSARLEAARSEARHERERLQLLTEAGDTLGSSLDYETTIRELGHYLVPAFADWCSVDLMDSLGVIENLVVTHRDPAKVELARELQRRYPPDPDAATGVPNVVRTGKSELIPNITDEMLQSSIPNSEEREAVRSLGLRSVMVVPLTANDRTFGALSFVGAESGFHYTERDLRLAQEIGHRAALAIANSRAYQAEADAKARAEEEATRNAILQAVTAALGRARTRTEVAEAILIYGLTAAGAVAGVVGLVEPPDRIEIVAIAGYDPDDQTYWRSFSLDDPYPLADAIREQHPVIMRSVSERDEQYPLLEDTGQLEDHPLVCLPLVLGDHGIGGISASFPAGSTFGEDRLAFLTAVADQAAQAIDRADSYDREQGARSQLDSLARVSQTLASTLNFETTTTRVLELAVTHLGREAVLYLMDGGKPQAVGRAWMDDAKGVQVETPEDDVQIGGMSGRSVARRSILDGEARLLDDAEDVMVLPLTIAGRTMGALVVVGLDKPRAHPSQPPLAFPQEIARRMARSLENARAYRDRDHVARTLQNSLLPPALPRVPNLKLTSLFRPAMAAYEIGGDFYDVFQTQDDRWAVVVGDVCGKGIEAAALTSLARYTIRAAFRTGSPSDVLRTLNESLLQQDLYGKFCTVCLVLVNPSPTGADVTISCAGHPLPQLVRSDGTITSVGRHGTLLGVTDDVRLADTHSRLEPGDTLVLYTDGLLDRSHQHLNETDQLRHAFERRRDDADPEDLKGRIERYVDALTGDQQDDDVAVLMVTATT